MTQKPLFKTEPAMPSLTVKQQLAFDYVRAHDSVYADEVGAWLHAHRDKHPHSVDERCEWCARDGRAVLTSRALHKIVKYRRERGARLYVVRHASMRPAADRTDAGWDAFVDATGGERDAA